MKWARVQVSKRAIEDFFPLPEGSKLIRVLPEDLRVYNQHEVELIIEHHDFEDVKEGAMLPTRTMRATRTEKTLKNPATLLVEWDK